MKTFKGDFDMFVSKIREGEHFALSRWGDGELMILENKKIDLRQKGDGEFLHDPTNKKCLDMRDVLLKSYTHKDENYYIGIACPCCVGDHKFEYMKKLSGQSEEALTWANIFVNSNYKYFQSNFIDSLKDKKVILIANRKGLSNKDTLPFKIEKYYSIGTDAWVDNTDLIQYLKTDIVEHNMKDYVFLFAAGPYANILTYELWKYNKNNTYIDIGSTLDKYLGLTLTRMYLVGGDTLNKTCVWG